ncbi:MAG TPA: hypothetical protein VMN58_01140 [Acidimicrobiales bacterium]|nr:hypothetical protein [Acidimicrobiales bacterium]
MNDVTIDRPEETPLPTRIAALAASVVTLVGVVALATYGGIFGSGAGGARLELAGRAVVEVEGERRMLDGGTHDLAEGATVELVDGSGVVRLPGGSSVELRSSRGVADDSHLLVDAVPVLLAGDALVETGDRALRLEAAGTTFGVDADSAARLAASTGASVATYRGGVAVASGGRTLAGGVPALRQAAVPGTGLVPRRPDPIAIAPEPDPWDRRHLGDAIELSVQLDRRSAGFTASVRGDSVSTAGVLRVALTELAAEPAVNRGALDDGRSPGEHLIGVGIALLADGGTFEERWQAALGFRDDGADWGIVALDGGVTRGPLLDLLDRAVDRSPILFASLPVGTGVDPTALDAPPPPAPTDPDRPPPDENPPPPDPDDPSPSPTPLPRTTEPLEPITDPVLEPLEPITDPVLEPLEPITDPVDDLLGGILEPVSSSGGGEPLAPATDPVEEVVDVAGGTAGGELGGS